MNEQESPKPRTQTQRLDNIETQLDQITKRLEVLYSALHSGENGSNMLTSIHAGVWQLMGFVQAMHDEFRPVLDRYKRAADAGSTFAALRQMRKDNKSNDH